MHDLFSQELRDLLETCPLNYREQVEASLIAYTHTLAGDDAEISARLIGQAQRLVSQAQEYATQEAWGIAHARQRDYRGGVLLSIE